MKNKKIVLITGISSGIGNAFVKLAVNYPELIIVGMGRNKPAEINDKNNYFYKIDLKDEESINKAVVDILKKFKHIDVLINNAGLGYRGTIEDMTMNEIRDQFEVNFFGQILLTNRVLPIMRSQKAGQIINVSSVASTMSTPTMGFYAATKSAMDKISEVLAQEVSPYNIQVNSVVPGAVKSRFGKNMIETKNASSGVYGNLYEEWKTRFRSYFKKHNSCDEVALKIMSLIKKPQTEIYIAQKDLVMCYLKKILPKSWFHWLFLKYYYQYESE